MAGRLLRQVRVGIYHPSIPEAKMGGYQLICVISPGHTQIFALQYRFLGIVPGADGKFCENCHNNQNMKCSPMKTGKYHKNILTF